MDLSRRELAVASAVALAVPGLLLSGFSGASRGGLIKRVDGNISAGVVGVR